MSYPLIILGAGASHDYIHPSLRGGQLMPPTTDHLTDVSYIDDHIARSYKEVDDLISVIAPRVNSKVKSLEECLRDIKNHEQLVAFRFYLKNFFRKFPYYPRNNYCLLVDHIKRTSTQKACVVSFNYDTFFDRAIGADFTEMPSYIYGKIQLVKVHGSCNWSYVHRSDFQEIGLVSDDPYEYLKSTPQYKPGEPYTDDKIATLPVGMMGFPAIAIPTGETKTFVCPISHIEALKKSMREVDRILIIGWKAGDPHLLKLMEECITQPVSIVIVSGTLAGADKIWEQLINIKHKKLLGKIEGFSKFVLDPLLDTFFDLDSR